MSSYFICIKGIADREYFSLLSTNDGKYSLYYSVHTDLQKLKYKLEDIKHITGFSEDYDRLVKLLPGYIEYNDIIFINLEDVYKNCFEIENDYKISRKDMLDRFEIDIHTYEPEFPKAHGTQPCKVYREIYKNCMKQYTS